MKASEEAKKYVSCSMIHAPLRDQASDVIPHLYRPQCAKITPVFLLIQLYENRDVIWFVYSAFELTEEQLKTFLEIFHFWVHFQFLEKGVEKGMKKGKLKRIVCPLWTILKSQSDSNVQTFSRWECVQSSREFKL